MSRPPDARSNGGYSLRTQGGKKHLSEDFEYYFSKIGTAQHNSGKKGCVSSPSDHNSERSSTQKRSNSRMLGINQEVLGDSAFAAGLKRVLYIDQNEICDEVVEEDISGNLTEEHHSNQSDILQFLVTPDSSATDLKVSDEYHAESNQSNVEFGEHEDEEDEESDMRQMGICTAPSSSDGNSGVNENGVSPGKIGKKRRVQYSDFSSGDVVRFRQLKSTDRVECLECHKLLKPNSYRQHIRTHTGEKPFSCTVCGAHFTRRGDVDRHVSIVHKKQKPFQCQQCNRSFGDRKNLRWHLANHDKKLFYVCPVCGFKFGKREYFENHVQFLHPAEAGSDEEAILQQVDQEQSSTAQMELEGLKIVSFKNSNSPNVLKLPVDQGSSLNDLSAPKSPQPADCGNTRTVVIQFDKDGNGHLSEWDPAGADVTDVANVTDMGTNDLVGSPVATVPSDEYIFDIAPDSNFAEASNWTHTLDRLSSNLKNSSQALRNSASQVIELVMDPKQEVTYVTEKLETPMISDSSGMEAKDIVDVRPCYVQGDTDGEQAIQVWGSANELEESQFILQDSTLILGQDSNSVVQFVTDDGTVLTGSDHLLASNVLDVKQNVVMKICGLQDSSTYKDVENCDFTSSGTYSNTMKTLLLSAADPVKLKPIN